MKMSKKILPALAMLIVSAIMLSTASFAWFALSEQVEADGMSVSIKSDSLYLLIAAVNEETIAEGFTAENTVLTAQQLQAYKSGTSGPKVGSTYAEGYAIGATNVYPSAYYKDGFTGNGTGIVDDGLDLKTPGMWYTATAENADASAMKTGTDTPLTAFDGYVVRYRYYVTLDVGSQAMDTLRVSSLTITDPINNDGTKLDPVRVVVACGEEMEEFKTNGTGTVDLTGDADLTATSALEIVIYVYYDGNDPSVTTNGVAALSTADIAFKLIAENDSETPGAGS